MNQQQQSDRVQKCIKVQPKRPQQPLQCPRCNSMNTKFCYYNNYNVAQPRHYCKTCRRYWTQGGTLRNIPIGGRCYKTKYTQNSSFSLSQKPQNMLLQTHHQPNLTTIMKGRDPLTRPLYQGGGGDGYLSSLPTIYSMNQSHATSYYDQSFKVGDDLLAGSSTTSNLGLASSFNLDNSLSSQHHIYPMGSGIERERFMPQQDLTIHNSVPSHTEWPWSFTNNNTNNRNYDTSLWSNNNISNSINTSINGNNIDTNANNVVDYSSLMQNQWSNYEGYGTPPSYFSANNHLSQTIENF